jgi:hypothetical protein
MDDDLTGRLVASAGINCTAGQMAGGGILQFLLLKREPEKMCALVQHADEIRTRETIGEGAVREIAAQFPAVDSGTDAD